MYDQYGFYSENLPPGGYPGGQAGSAEPGVNFDFSGFDFGGGTGGGGGGASFRDLFGQFFGGRSGGGTKPGKAPGGGPGKQPEVSFREAGGRAGKNRSTYRVGNRRQWPRA